MFALHTLLADSVVMTGNIFGFHFVITMSQIIYWLIAAIVGIIAEFIVGWRLPFGFIGAILAALLGIWLLTNVVSVTIPGDVFVYGLPLFKALPRATVLVALWHLVTYRSWSHRRRYT